MNFPFDNRCTKQRIFSLQRIETRLFSTAYPKDQSTRKSSTHACAHKFSSARYNYSSLCVYVYINTAHMRMCVCVCVCPGTWKCAFSLGRKVSRVRRRRTEDNGKAPFLLLDRVERLQAHFITVLSLGVPLSLSLFFHTFFFRYVCWYASSVYLLLLLPL